MKSSSSAAAQHVGFPFYSLDPEDGSVTQGIPCMKQGNEDLLVKSGGKRPHQFKIFAKNDTLSLRNEHGKLYIDSGYFQEFNDDSVLKICGSPTISQDQAFLYLPVTHDSRIRIESLEGDHQPIARSFVILKPGSRVAARISNRFYVITCTIENAKIRISAHKIA